MMADKEQNVLITGSTGLIGQHILFEKLHEYASRRKQGGVIYLLIRAKEGRGATSYIRDLLNNRWTPDYLKKFPLNQLLSYIQIIEGDIRDHDLDILINNQIPHHCSLQVYHSAGSVNLRIGEAAEQEVMNNNYKGTQTLLRALRFYPCQFMFISTAFSCGIREGIIYDQHEPSADPMYRNPYEQSKAEIEQMVESFGARYHMKTQIARPSVVVGRMLDQPVCYTSKFDVIYGWAQFFWMMREKAAAKKLRIQINLNSGMNIVPVDVVAKACVRLSRTNIRQLNIVHEQSISHRDYLSQILNALGFDHYEFVEVMPEDLSSTEKFYYRTVGSVFEPYLNGPQYHFDTTVLTQLMEDVPQVDIHAGIKDLIAFAMAHDFREDRVREGEQAPGDTAFHARVHA
ncbi:SDR family oxidoreductase [Paenibacillus sp. HB172176]|uniref:SDR family oxidoreductase n=1 Tax=Paenibacillus sp. HB172176 TaxID=2493690 RepID=UPI001439DA1B|nr:SDR family oxidoreductase [Paenibacillus sp. HB172176]